MLNVIITTGRERGDLIVLCYFDPKPYAEKVVAALRPGGVLVVEGFHKRTGTTRLRYASVRAIPDAAGRAKLTPNRRHG